MVRHPTSLNTKCTTFESEHSMSTRKSTQAAPAASVNESAEIVLSPAAARPCEPLGTTILDLGARIGVLDQRSRKLMGVMLQWLADEPDDAPEIADKVMALARVQQPMVRSAELHQALNRPNARAHVASKGVQS